MTFPLIGNYGVPDEDSQDEFGLAKFFESDCIHVKSVLFVNGVTITTLIVMNISISD